jgi:hypothetical protein
MARAGAKVATILSFWLQRHSGINGAGQVHIGLEVMAFGTGKMAGKPPGLGGLAGMVAEGFFMGFSMPQISTHEIPNRDQQ